VTRDGIGPKATLYNFRGKSSILVKRKTGKREKLLNNYLEISPMSSINQTVDSALIHAERQLKSLQDFFQYDWLAMYFLSKWVLEDQGRLEAMRSMPGFVYFIELMQLGRVKIGYTTDVLRRFKDLQFTTSTPGQLRLLCVGYGSYEIERCLHDIFAPRRVFNEWFSFPDEDIKFLSNLQNADAWGMAVLGPLASHASELGRNQGWNEKDFERFCKGLSQLTRQ
jgi:hypothetical protein